jgi:hypothetical protein
VMMSAPLSNLALIALTTKAVLHPAVLQTK